MSLESIINNNTYCKITLLLNNKLYMFSGKVKKHKEEVYKFIPLEKDKKSFLFTKDFIISIKEFNLLEIILIEFSQS